MSVQQLAANFTPNLAGESRRAGSGAGSEVSWRGEIAEKGGRDEVRWERAGRRVRSRVSERGEGSGRERRAWARGVAHVPMDNRQGWLASSDCSDDQQGRHGRHMAWLGLAWPGLAWAVLDGQARARSGLVQLVQAPCADRAERASRASRRDSRHSQAGRHSRHSRHSRSCKPLAQSARSN